MMPTPVFIAVHRVSGSVVLLNTAYVVSVEEESAGGARTKVVVSAIGYQEVIRAKESVEDIVKAMRG